MNLIRKQMRKALGSRPLTAGVLLALFAFVLAMAQFRTLHRFCHAEADQKDHQCAVTMLVSGQVDAPSYGVIPAPVQMRFVGEPSAPTSFVPSADFFLLPSRGPPAPLA